MIRFLTAAAAALIAGWIVAGSTTSASAHCRSCGPLTTTVRVHTIHPHRVYTRYHDRSVVVRVPREHRIVTVTRVQPIVHIHEVTRIHHHTIYVVRNTYANETVRLPPLTYVSPSVVNIYDGGCGCRF